MSIMKIHINRSSLIILLLVILLGITACGSQIDTTPVPPEKEKPVTTPVPPSTEPVAAEPGFVEVESISMWLGQEEVARGTVLNPIVLIQPYNATDMSYTLSSGNERVLRNARGFWTAVRAGTAEFTATSSNGLKASVTISVVVPVESLSLGVKEIVTSPGESYKLVPVIDPNDATDQQISYESDNEDVAVVSNDGTITAVTIGKATIKVTVGGVTETCEVIVTTPVTAIKVVSDKRSYSVGDKGSFSVQFAPPEALDKSFTAEISGAATLTGDNSFTCDFAGQVTITVTTSNGITGTLTFSVIDLAAFADEVFRLTNLEREKQELPPFSRMLALTNAAELRAKETIERFSHTRPDGSECFTALDECNVVYRTAGENIAAGQTTPAEVVRGWMDSPGHRANIENNNFGHLGVGLAMDSNGRLYWAQFFTD